MKQKLIYKNPANLQVSIVENEFFNREPSTIMPLGRGWMYNLDITEEELKYPNGQVVKKYYANSFRVGKKMSLNEMINAFIRCYYTIDDELAIQRQRDSKPAKFQEYDEDVKQIIKISSELYKKFQ